MGVPIQIRVYDNEISVWNDGGLPEGITEADLKKIHRSKPRNPVIADVCFKGGYIDSWGRGTIKIIDSCREANLPEPEMKDEQGGFLIRIFKNNLTKEQLIKLGLNDRQLEATFFVKEKGKISNSDYQELFSASKASAT